MNRVAINGYGRIGRCVLRAWVERYGRGGAGLEKPPFAIVAINEPADLDTMAYLSRYDSTHGRFPGELSIADKALVIDGQPLAVTHIPELEQLDWRASGADLVMECSGAHNSRTAADQHLAAGAQAVLFSHPATADVDATVVYGLNHQQLSSGDKIVSNASCTTNCIVPVIKVLDDAFGIAAGQITTIHSMMNDQPVIDAYHHTDLRKTRSATQSMIPVDTALAKGIERLLPDMEGRFAAQALRVPTNNVSAMDLTIQTRSAASVQDVNTALREASNGALAGVLDYTEEPLASCDFNHNPHSGVVDGAQTRAVQGQLIKVFVWFDNEWGFANRMLDVAACMLGD